MQYIETELKILDIDLHEVVERLRSIGAEEVFDADRVITHFDHPDNDLRDHDEFLKLTEEGHLKLSHTQLIDGQKDTVKLRVSRKQECIDLLSRLGLEPIAVVTARRISFEWKGVDFDIDEYPSIPPFLSIDPGQSTHRLETIVQLIGVEHNETTQLPTPELYTKYGFDYFELFKITE